jgi:hypothetical protein
VRGLGSRGRNEIISSPKGYKNGKEVKHIRSGIIEWSLLIVLIGELDSQLILLIE